MSLYLFVYAAIALFHSLHQRLWIYLCSPLFNSPTIYPPHQRLWIYLHLPPIYIPIIHPPHQRLWIYHQLLQLNSLGFNFLARGSEFIINSCNRVSKDSTSSPGALNLSSLQQLNLQEFNLLTRGSKFIIISTTEFPRIYPPHQGILIYHHSNNWISENSPFLPRALNLPSYRPSSSQKAL